MSQGAKAVDAGEKLRKEVWSFFKKNGFHPLEYSSTFAFVRSARGVITKYPYTNWYGATEKSHFVLFLNDVSYRIDCHGQESNGTATVGKIPGFLENARSVKENYILILDGNGIPDDAKKWALLRAKKMSERTGRSIYICFSVEGAFWYLSDLLK